MRVILDDETVVEANKLRLDDWRRLMAEFLQSSPDAAKAWDIMACVRGPDYPSERPNMGSETRTTAYARRRRRKYETVEVIRQAMFFGTVGGAARHRQAEKVKLPPEVEWDHFDQHVKRAADPLGIPVKIKSKKTWELEDYKG